MGYQNDKKIKINSCRKFNSVILKLNSCLSFIAKLSEDARLHQTSEVSEHRWTL